MSYACSEFQSCSLAIWASSPFGQAAFYGLGGYTVAMLMTKVHFNFWLSIVAGVLVASIIGLIVGFFCVRLRGIYFAVLTLAFGQLIFFIVFKWHNFTGGDDGIQGSLPSRVSEISNELLLFSSNRFLAFSFGLVEDYTFTIWPDHCVHA